MKYKVGDKVKIREDLIVDNEYGSDTFIEDMERYKGGIATITDVDNDKYSINLDNGDWSWTDEMFEDNTSKFHVGDKVRVRRDLEVDEKYNGLTLTSGMYACHDIMTIEMTDNDDYLCKENGFWWGEDMLEKVEEVNDNEQVRTVDVGFHLDYCGHRVLKDVWQGETGVNRLYYTKNYDIQYILPIDAIDFIIPHED